MFGPRVSASSGHFNRLTDQVSLLLPPVHLTCDLYFEPVVMMIIEVQSRVAYRIERVGVPQIRQSVHALVVVAQRLFQSETFHFFCRRFGMCWPRKRVKCLAADSPAHQQQQQHQRQRRGAASLPADNGSAFFFWLPT